MAGAFLIGPRNSVSADSFESVPDTGTGNGRKLSQLREWTGDVNFCSGKTHSAGAATMPQRTIKRFFLQTLALHLLKLLPYFINQMHTVPCARKLSSLYYI
jgi:hypothetical protein